VAGRPLHSNKLEEKSAREKLKKRKKPYFGRVDDKLSIGYVRQIGAGQWVARRETGRKISNGLPYAVYETHSIGSETDFPKYKDAKAAVEAWAGRPGNAPQTLRDMIPIYEAKFKSEKKIDWKRSKGIIDKHLIPFFGDKRLSEFRDSDGDAYINSRKAASAADGTVNREFRILMRLLNLAVKNKGLASNDLKRTLLEENERTRVATPEELKRIVNNKENNTLRRAAIVALNTGLRRGAVLSIKKSWIKHNPDGPWLLMPASKSKNKTTPKSVPLNQLAYAALMDSDEDRCFNETGENFTNKWKRLCEAEEIEDLRFHDLRHTFATALERLRVDYELRSLLSGHKLKRMTARYEHGGPEVEAEKRDAMTRLDVFYTQPEVVRAIDSPVDRAERISA
jgi:integrase